MNIAVLIDHYRLILGILRIQDPLRLVMRGHFSISSSQDTSTIPLSPHARGRIPSQEGILVIIRETALLAEAEDLERRHRVQQYPGSPRVSGAAEEAEMRDVHCPGAKVAALSRPRFRAQLQVTRYDLVRERDGFVGDHGPAAGEY